MLDGYVEPKCRMVNITAITVARHLQSGNIGNLIILKPITVVAQSKACAVFASSNTGVLGSTPTRGMNVSLRLFCVFVVLCVGSGLANG
jgi:hypothetical protein